MLARRWEPKDYAAASKLLRPQLEHDLNPAKDNVLVVGDAVEGCLVWRPMGVIHELECSNSHLQANALVNYAMGQAVSKLWQLQEAAFVINADNAPMLRFAKEAGAIEWPGKHKVMLIPLR